jgi:TPR repeat protein
MRISDAVRGLVLVLAAVAPAAAFDGTPSPKQLTPAEMARAGAESFRQGNLEEAIQSWTRAAQNGHVMAQWRLGRLFADGDAIERDDLRAFQWFRQIVEGARDVDPGSPRAQIASRAFVELGSYYLVGIPNSDVRQDFGMALRMFYHAASVFGDKDAQYHLARMYLDGSGVEHNPRLAIGWLRNSAERGHHGAQATLGELLFNGRYLDRRPVEGLMWLQLARQQARGARDQWIVTAFEDAVMLATDGDRQRATQAARRWPRR